MVVAKHVLKYLKGILDSGLMLMKSNELSLIRYTDTNWVNCDDDGRSVNGYCIFFGEKLVS